MNTGTFQRSDNILEQAAQAKSRLIPPQLIKPQPSVDTSGSPTKGILWTPGTTSKFRKTVSFGDGVVDNEPQRLFGKENRSSSDGTMATAAPTRPTNDEQLLQNPFETMDDFEHLDLGVDEDVTTDLTQPHSQSGNFWKKEYDDYRAKTIIETRKLVEYRSAAKEYARKQAVEAQRLAKQLHEKDATISDLKTRLRASQILTTTRKDDTKHREEIEELQIRQMQQEAELREKDAKIEELAKQLEQAKSRTPIPENKPSDQMQHEDELKERDARIEELSRRLEEAESINTVAENKSNNQYDDEEIEALRSAVESSEEKLKELKTENSKLKRMLARVKAEMSNYEARRKAKEERLKARESKLEERLQIYRQELKNTKQELADNQERFNEEKETMLDVVNMLRTKLTMADPSEGVTEAIAQIIDQRDQRDKGKMPPERSNVPHSSEDEDDLMELPRMSDTQFYRRQTFDDEERQEDVQNDQDGTPDASPSKELSHPPPDVAQTPRMSMVNRKANLGRFVRPAMSPGVSFTPQGPASAKKAAMSSQRLHAAEARLRIRSRRGV